MSRPILLSILLLQVSTGFAQVFSDHGTPLVNVTPGECTTWQRKTVTVDSMQQLVKEVAYRRDGKQWKRRYFLTLLDTVYTEVCLRSDAAGGMQRQLKIQGYRTWHRDEIEPGLHSFLLPRALEKEAVVSEVAQVTYDGSAKPAFLPAVLRIPSNKAQDTVQVQAFLNGKMLTASVVMINPALKVNEAEAPLLSYLKGVNKVAEEKLTPVLHHTSTMLARQLAPVGAWQSIAKAHFDLKAEAYRTGCVLETTAYHLYGLGSASFEGQLTIPVAVLPAIAKFVYDKIITLPLSVTLPFVADEKTSCGSYRLQLQSNGTWQGRQRFRLRSNGYSAVGEVTIQNGSMSTAMTLLPQVTVDTSTLSAGEIKLRAVVEDRWGWARWRVESVLWNGASAVPLSSKSESQ